MVIKKTGTKEWSTVSKNIFFGCRHNCRYCYARANALRFKQITKPEEWTDMHLNARSLNERPRFYKGVENRIMFPSSHDILPEHLDVTVEYLKKWLGAGNSMLIVSKPHLECIVRLCNDLEQYKDQIVFRFTIGSYDDKVLKFWEPDAPSYTERMQSLKHAYKKGYKTSVSCEPYLDGSVTFVVDAVSSYVNDTIWVGLMNAIAQRVDTTGWTKEDFAFLESTKNCQTKDTVEFLYQELHENPKVRFKDSIKRVLGLPEEEIG
jgi:DNA repair photolyase